MPSGDGRSRFTVPQPRTVTTEECGTCTLVSARGLPLPLRVYTGLWKSYLAALGVADLLDVLDRIEGDIFPRASRLPSAQEDVPGVTAADIADLKTRLDPQAVLKYTQRLEELQDKSPWGPEEVGAGVEA